jgi:multiple sugar transport system permease protein
MKHENAYIWMSPALLALALLVVYPWIWTFWVSLMSWNPLQKAEPRFIGLGNYLHIFSDPTFLQAIGQTLLLTFCSVGLQFLLGFGLALLLNTDIPGIGFFRTVLLLPMMLTPSVIGMVWKIMLHDEFGVINWMLASVGIKAVGWLSDPGLTMPIIIFIQVWLHTPFAMLMLLAGLRSIPEELIESAKVDGAHVLQRLRYIIIPWLMPIITLVLLFRVTYELRAFDTIYGIWRSSGPLNSGLVLGTYLYEQMRLFWRFGEGSALSYILLLLTVLATLKLILELYRSLKR